MFNYRFLLYTFGAVLSKIAWLMLLPIAVALFTNFEGLAEFLRAFVLLYAISFILTRRKPTNLNLRVKDMLLMTTLTWIVTCIFASLPFILIQHISFADAYFETMSGLTTTGSSVLSNLDSIAPSLLMWRSTLQWIGGLGFIVMAVAVLPFLNVGGMTLFRTESSDWSEKSLPHAKDVATNIIKVYSFLTALCTLSFMWGGMSFYDAINHAFTTLSTGGFSTHDSSMNGFSVSVQWFTTLFMFLGSLPFLLFTQALHQKSFKILLHDQQIQGFFFFILAMGSFLTLWLWHKDIFNFSDSLRIAFFSLINIMSTTGFSLGNFDQWTAVTTLILAIAFLLGGCSGSTAGGIKTFRFQIIFKVLRSQISQLIHPNSISPIHYNRKIVANETIFAIIAFIFCYFLSIFILGILMTMTGMDVLDSLSSAMTAVGNVGPGLGAHVGPSGNFADIPESAKWLMSVGMLLGRLEITTAIVLLFPTMWRN